MSGVYSMVLAGGVGSRLSFLTEQRAKPAVPFGGKFRIVDFVLSNLTNSGLFDVGLVTQYRPLSLIDHVGTGQTWDLDRTFGGLQILQPYLEAESGDWYSGTADAVYRNLFQVTQRTATDVLVLSGDHVYAMDYRPILRFHREHRFPATVAVTPVEPDSTSQFGIVETNRFSRITGFQEKPKVARGNLASMGVYVFKRETLIRVLEEDAHNPESGHDFGRDVFPRLITEAAVGAYTFDGYWQDIGTVDAFYEANMKFLDPEHMRSLARPSWPSRTPSMDAPPARVSGSGSVRRSLVANGAVIRGRVENSILFPLVTVEEGAVVKDAILMSGCHVQASATVERSILDKRVVVGPKARIGGDGTARANEREPDLFHAGLSLLGKNVTVGERAAVGRNVCVGGRRIIDADAVVPDGAYLEGTLSRSVEQTASTR